jgi:23S rRNA pseudouridine1911/1915/1917 synthase
MPRSIILRRYRVFMIDTKIIYEDNDIIIARKPSGLATQSSKIGQQDLVSELRNYRKQKGEDTYIGVIHRLDQPVEGLLVFAKNKSSAANLTKQLDNGTLRKSYTALVDGIIPIGEKIELVDYLLKDSRTNTSKVVNQGTKDAKKARLIYTCIDNDTDEGYSRVEVEIFTGRHHQIRVQMSNAGHPLLGDVKYGNQHSNELSNRLNIKNTALYADKISLLHPVSGKKLDFNIKRHF